jgi:hypothetical protein
MHASSFGTLCEKLDAAQDSPSPRIALQVLRQPCCRYCAKRLSCGSRRRDLVVPVTLQCRLFAYSSLTIHMIMPTPNRFKAPLVLLVALVLLCAGVAVLVGVFGLLVKLVGAV